MQCSGLLPKVLAGISGKPGRHDREKREGESRVFVFGTLSGRVQTVGVGFTGSVLDDSGTYG